MSPSMSLFTFVAFLFLSGSKYENYQGLCSGFEFAIFEIQGFSYICTKYALFVLLSLHFQASFET